MSIETIVSGQLNSPIVEILKDYDISTMIDYAKTYGVYFYENVNLSRYYAGVVLNNELIALGMFGISEWDGRNLWITALCSMVKGYGTKVLMKIEEMIKEIFPNQTVYIESRNDTIKFYERFGYSQIEKIYEGYTIMDKRF